MSGIIEAKGSLKAGPATTSRALFFGAAPPYGAAPLYGFVHEPGPESRSGSPLLLVPPIGPEAIRQHRALRQMAVAAERGGSLVLRFDFRGHGDSAGAARDVELRDWIEDVQAARAELVRLNGGPGLSVMAFGFGALVAHLALAGQSLEDFVIVDAPEGGAAFWQDLEARHRSNARTTAARWRSEESGGPIDLLGFEFGRAARESIESAGWSPSGPVVRRWIAASTAPAPVAPALLARFRDAEALHHPWPAGLDDDPFKPRVPQTLIQALIEVLARRPA